MRVLAIDPGYERLGVAILEKTPRDRREKVLFSTCIRTSPKQSHPERLHTLWVQLEELCTLYSPEYGSIEKLFFSKNQKTALLVAEARGVVLALMKKNNLQIMELFPNEIKVAVTGTGNTDKKMVITMVDKLVALTDSKRTDDEYDAIACGITFFAQHKTTLYPQKQV